MTQRPPQAELDWSERGAPRSRRFGDVYFSLEDGLAESRAVFLAGCGLPEAWAGRRAFTVGELGFGAGLNVLALVDLWRRARPAGGRLHVFTVEAYPMARADAARAHAAWPELAPVSAALLAQWPAPTPGFHRLELPGDGVIVDVAQGEAAEMLAAWDGRADAWFLDGFAPAANPEMWRPELIGLVAARSAPGARAATFTVAGAVRRALAEAGFAAAKRPGHGRKRERLEATWPGVPAPEPAPPEVAVVGAGIAGAACARALGRLGATVTVVEADGPGAGASGNASALVTPHLDAGGGAEAALAAQAFRRAVALYADETPAAVRARGVLRLARGARDAARFAAVAAQPLWPADSLAPLDPAAVAARLGEPVGPAGLDLAEALVIDPAPVLAAWLAGAERRPGRVTGIEAGADGARLALAGGGVMEVGAVVLAAGWGLAALRPELALSALRGQVTVAEGVGPSPATSGSGYAIPAAGGLLFGATHDRGDADPAARPGDDARNLEVLARSRPRLAAALAGRPLRGRAGVRASTPDHLPLCGPLGPGAWALGGLGGRGYALAPLLGEHLAAAILGRPSPLPAGLAALVSPARPGLAMQPNVE